MKHHFATTSNWEKTVLRQHGFDDIYRAAHVHPRVLTDETGLVDTSVGTRARELLHIRCPVCEEPAVVPAHPTHRGDGLAHQLSCLDCEWTGRDSTVQSKQILSLLEDDAHEHSQQMSLKTIVSTPVTTVEQQTQLDTEQICRLKDQLPDVAVPEISIVEQTTIPEEVVEDATEIFADIRSQSAVKRAIRMSYASQTVSSGEFTDDIQRLCRGLSRYSSKQRRTKQEMRSIPYSQRTSYQTRLDEIADKKDDIKRQLKRQLSAFVSSIDGLPTYRLQITAILCCFQPISPVQIGSDILSSVVNCSPDYAAQYTMYTETPFPIVTKQDYVAHRESQALTDAEKTTIVHRDDSQCLRCFSTTNLEVHHIQPISQGGNSDADNLATLCHGCHLEAHGGSYRGNTAYGDAKQFEDWYTSSATHR